MIYKDKKFAKRENCPQFQWLLHWVYSHKATLSCIIEFKSIQYKKKLKQIKTIWLFSTFSNTEEPFTSLTLKDPYNTKTKQNHWKQHNYKFLYLKNIVVKWQDPSHKINQFQIINEYYILQVSPTKIFRNHRRFITCIQYGHQKNPKYYKSTTT